MKRGLLLCLLTVSGVVTGCDALLKGDGSSHSDSPADSEEPPAVDDDTDQPEPEDTGATQDTGESDEEAGYALINARPIENVTLNFATVNVKYTESTN